jgi:GDP/UDP-N,N'-diacetylbacillosamine 2-epimerase (hydrolysing)
MNRKVCVITGTRAEYGLLRWLMEGLRDDAALSLEVVATGMHLSPEFGLTYREIEQNGFEISHRVEMLLSSDTSVGISKSIGLGIIGFTDVLAEMQPDLLVVLGDRFEIFAAVSAALILKIPVAHIHGGELTEGAFDDALRHSITKMSHLHFVATEEYRNRVVQLGEQPDSVFVTGGLGVDCISRISLLDREKLEESLGVSFLERNLLITYHPATLGDVSAGQSLSELLEALDKLDDTFLIFTCPNADTDGRLIKTLLEDFVASHSNSKLFTSLGQTRYFSCIAEVDGVIGNSSSGLLEVPSFNKGTVNIGNRQQGRLKASSVIDCEPVQEDIYQAIGKLYSPEFQSLLPSAKNPYGEKGAAENIVETIRNVSLEGVTKKTFYDIDDVEHGN